MAKHHSELLEQSVYADMIHGHGVAKSELIWLPHVFLNWNDVVANKSGDAWVSGEDHYCRQQGTLPSIFRECQYFYTFDPFFHFANATVNLTV